MRGRVALSALVLLVALAPSVAAEAVDPPDAAARAARQEALNDPADAPPRVQRALFAAWTRRERGETDRAREVLRRQLADHPDEDHPLLRLHLGNLLAAQDSLAAARAQLQAAVALEPDLAAAWRNLGEVAYAQEDHAAAAAAFARAAALAPADVGALRYYEAVSWLLAGRPARALDRLLADPPADDLDWHRALLSAALASDRAADAGPALDDLVRARPDDPEAWLLAAQQDQAAGDFAGAVAHLEVAGWLRPRSRDETMLLGDLARAAGVPARAAAAYREAFALAPPTPEERDRLVAALLAAHRTDEALAALDARLAQEPAADAWRLKGELLYDGGRHDEALAALDEAAALDPDDARLDLLRGYCLLELGREDEAAARLRSARRDPRWRDQADAALAHLQRATRG